MSEITAEVSGFHRQTVALASEKGSTGLQNKNGAKRRRKGRLWRRRSEPASAKQEKIKVEWRVFRGRLLHDSQLEQRMLEASLIKLIRDWFSVYYAHRASGAPS